MEHLQDQGEPRHSQQAAISRHQPPAASAVDAFPLPAGIHSSSLAADSALDWDDQHLVDSAVDEANGTSLLADQGQGAAAGFMSQHCRPSADGRCRGADGGKIATAKMLRSNLTLEQLASLQLSHPALSSWMYKGSLNRVDVDIIVVQHKSGCAAKVAAEVQKMQSLAHPNVVSSRHFVTWSCACAAGQAATTAAVGGGLIAALGGTGSSPDDGISGLMETWVVQEGGSFGTLRDVLDGKEVILQVLLEVGRGMAYLHSECLVHGSLTASSVAMTEQPVAQSSSTSSRCSSPPLTDLNTPSASGSRCSGAGDTGGDKSASCISGSLSRRFCTSSCKRFKHALSSSFRGLGRVTCNQAAVVADCSKGSHQQGPPWSDIPSNSRTGAAGDDDDDDCCATAGCLMTAALVPKVAMLGLPGLMQAAGSSADHLCPAVMGPISHQSPELMRTGQPSRPADVFAFGVVMWEAITGQVPWEGKLPGEIILAVMVEEGHLAFGQCIPKEYVSLAQSCMQKDPCARPTLAEVVGSLSKLLEQSQLLQQQVDAAWGSVSGYPNV
eukprot:gene12563-12695_t